MARKIPSSGETPSALASAGDFHFVTVEAAPSKTTQLAAKRQARSHAVRQALENKRKLQQEAGDNFWAATWKESLAVDSSRLQALLSRRETRCASEPVFTITKEQEREFQNFRCVFRTRFVDPALLNAVMLSLAVAAAHGRVDGECLGYRGKAIGYIRERVSSRNEATTESTIGAILLLAGVEARLGKTSQVQLHLGAVRQLLDLCQKEGIHLTGGIKRAVFWQDLNAAVLLGSSRIVDHTTFGELQWTRDALPAGFFAVPAGFQTRPHLFPEELLEVLKDIRALQWIRDRAIYSRTNPVEMARINDQIASIQSRLESLRNFTPTMECFRLAAYICSVLLCCSMWCAAVFPSDVSSQLLRVLQQTHHDSLWDDDPDLLLWILYIGGTFAPRGQVRSN